MMHKLVAKLGDQPWVWLTGITLLSAACVAAGLRVIPSDKLLPDFISHWAAAALVASGGNPYDAPLQTRIQQELGWDPARDGLGKYDFLPYYYPPWLAMAIALAAPLGFEGARVVFFFLNVELLFLSGYLLSCTVVGVPRLVPTVVVPLFALSLDCLLIGQTSILMLFVASLGWWFLERGRDRAGGAALAFLTTKPQLGAILILALLLWAARRGRWRVVHWFALTLGAVSVAGAAIAPSWPLEMVRTSVVTPPPTTYYPWIGTTWLLLLRTAGLTSWGLWTGYLVVAVPFLILVTRTSLDRSRPLSDVMALGILAAFVVAPYGRHYDFPLLLIPLFVLMGGRLPELAGAGLMVALMILPYLHFGAVADFKQKYPTTVRLFPECTFLWIPALVTAAWLISEARSGRRRRTHELSLTQGRREGSTLVPPAPEGSPPTPEGSPS